MPASLPLGNDIVDLQREANKRSASNPRYRQRVLAPEEISVLAPENFSTPAQTAANDRAFWAYWAAKETGYKALKKIDPDLVFAHRRFVVRPDNPEKFFYQATRTQDATAPDGAVPNVALPDVALPDVALPDVALPDVVLHGVVMHGTRCVPVHWEWNNDYVHCVSTSHIQELHYQVRLQSELGGSASIAVRRLATDLLARADVQNVEIVRPLAGSRPGPPQVMRGDQPVANIDISLSHDGRFVAAAICRAPG